MCSTPVICADPGIFYRGGGGGVQTETFFSPQLILQRGGGAWDGNV